MTAGTAATGPPIPYNTNKKRIIKGRSTKATNEAEAIKSFKESNSLTTAETAPVGWLMSCSLREMRSNKLSETSISTMALALSVYRPRNTFMEKSNSTITRIPTVSAISDSIALLGITRSYTTIM